MRIEILPDKYGPEISFKLERVSPKGEFTTIDQLEMGAIEAPNSDRAVMRRYIYIYQDLPFDSVFILKVEDLGQDGICCDHGEGSITVYEIDNTTSEVMSEILKSDGQYGSQLDEQFFFPSIM